ncbi:MAG: oligosaccharide flippase family protein [Candidatus Rariloculaceae bacterium]
MTLGHNIAWLGSSAGLRQIWVLATLPLLTRRFGPEDFGFFALFVTALIVSSLFAGLRYDSAAVVPASDRVSSSCIAAVFFFGAVVSAIFAVMTIVLMSLLGKSWIGVDIGVVGAGAAVAVLASAVQRGTTAWATRKQYFRLLSLSTVIMSFSMVVLQIVFYERGMNPISALVWGYTLSIVLAAAILFGAIVLRDRRFFQGWHPRFVIYSVLRYRKFPRYMVPYGLISALRERMMILLLGLFSGVSVIGIYEVASRITTAPNSLLYSAIGPVLFSYSAKNKGVQSREAGLALSELTLLVLTVPFAMLAAEAELVPIVVLGERWAETGSTIFILAPAMLIFAATSWLDRLFDVHGQQAVALKLQLWYTVSAAVLVSSAMIFGGTTAGIVAFSGFSFCFFILYMAVALNSTGASGKLPTTTLLVCVTAYLAVIGIGRGNLISLNTSSRISIYISVMIGVISIYVFLLDGRKKLSRLAAS